MVVPCAMLIVVKRSLGVKTQLELLNVIAGCVRATYAGVTSPRRLDRTRLRRREM